MDASDFHTRWRIARYIALWCAVSSTFACVMMPLVSQPFLRLWLDGASFAGFFAILIPFIWNVVKYGNLLALNSILKIVVLSALGLLAVSVWLGISLLFLYWILGSETLSLLAPTIPLYGMIGILLYIIIIQIIATSCSQQLESEDEVCEVAQIVSPSAVSDPKEPIPFIDRVTVKIGSNIRVIPVGAIYYLQSEGDYVLIITEKEKFIKEQTMKYFEQNLPKQQFVRIHRSFIVNVSSISRIECYGNNKQAMTLRNGVQLKMSVAGYRLLKETLNL
jgi:hypothetical protein